MEGLPLSETSEWLPQAFSDPLHEWEDSKIPFSICHELNSRIRIFHGDCWRLACDAMIIGMNERLNDRSEMNEDIFRIGGPAFVEDCRRQGRCQTGQAIDTVGGGLPCKHVIHAVGPVYHPRFISASQHALHSAYRSALAHAINLKVKTLAISCIYLERKGYPRVDATHIALRTIRRFLEHHPTDFDVVILCTEQDEDATIHAQLLPAYFPRNQEEAMAELSLLPEDIGDEWGELRSEERKIRVAALPGGSTAADESSTRRMRAGSGAVLSRAAPRPPRRESEPPLPVVTDMTKMTEDIDYAKMRRLMEHEQSLTPEQRQQAKFDSLIRRANSANLSDVSGMKYIYPAGYDKAGNRIVVLVGRNLDAENVNMDRVALHLIKTMEQVAREPYVIFYLHSNVEDRNTPELAWLKKIFDIFNYRYKESLQVVYIYGASMWLKFVMWALFPMLSSVFWEKSQFISSSDELARSMDPGVALLPDDVF